MRKISLYALIATIACPTLAAATPSHVYIGTLAAHNIGAYQYSIANAAFRAFGDNIAHTAPTHRAIDTRPARDLYGHAPEYGTMPTYGEFGDDTGILAIGRNGGDLTEIAVSNTWIDVKYYDEHARLNNFHTTENNYVSVMAGLTAGHHDTPSGAFNWGVFGGYLGGYGQDDNIKIRQNTGYVGIYGGYHVAGLDTGVIINVGTADNKTTATGFDAVKFDNGWVGIATNTEYNFSLDDITTLTPGLYTSYTLASQNDYLVDNLELETKNTHLLSLAPGLRMSHYLGNGWYGTIGGRYVFNFISGGEITWDDISVSELTPRDFSEYGINVERSFNKINLNLYLSHRDGGLTGWNGGANIKYVF